jgi:protein involved in polysaccharide export with SLBB domain
MQVNIWGFVKNPGRYEVPSSTDLIQLISFAGGPVQYAEK